jgi:hypothetical protein
MIFKLLKFIGKINTAIILSIVWFLILLPLSILKHLFTKDSYHFSWDRSATSSWIERNHEYQKEDLKNEW